MYSDPGVPGVAVCSGMVAGGSASLVFLLLSSYALFNPYCTYPSCRIEGAKGIMPEAGTAGGTLSKFGSTGYSGWYSQLLPGVPGELLGVDRCREDWAYVRGLICVANGYPGRDCCIGIC